MEGIGPRKARALGEEAGVRNLADLERAAREGRIRDLPHFGERSERKVLEAVAFHEEAAGRRPIGEVLEIARSIETALARVRGVARAAVAGSIRRHRETVGDVDVLVASLEPELAGEAFAALPGSRSGTPRSDGLGGPPHTTSLFSVWPPQTAL